VKGEVRQRRTVGIEGGHQDTMRSGFEGACSKEGTVPLRGEEQKYKKGGALLDQRKAGNKAKEKERVEDDEREEDNRSARRHSTHET